MENKEIKPKKPFYKKWWFWLIVVFIVVGIFGNSDEDTTNEETETEEANVAVDQEEEEDVEEVDLDIEIEITDTQIDDENVTVKGTTNLIDGTLLSYQIRATEDHVEVQNGEWEVVESIEKLANEDEENIYGDGTEYNFYITFPPVGVDEQQEEVLEVYGGAGGTKIEGGPNFYESDDGTLKMVSLRVEFDEDGIIDEAERESRDFDQAVEDWNDHVKDDMLEHYGEFGVIGIEMNPGSDWDVVNVFVPNEFKLSSEEEKRYYVEELGPLLEADLTSHFNKEHSVHVYFKYEDGNDMATRKMFGGWNIK